MVYMTYPTEPSDIFTMFGSSIYSPNNVLFGGNRRVPAGLAQAPICCCQRVKSNLIKGFWVLHWGFPFKNPCCIVGFILLVLASKRASLP